MLWVSWKELNWSNIFENVLQYSTLIKALCYCLSLHFNSSTHNVLLVLKEEHLSRLNMIWINYSLDQYGCTLLICLLISLNSTPVLFHRPAGVEEQQFGVIHALYCSRGCCHSDLQHCTLIYLEILWIIQDPAVSSWCWGRWLTVVKAPRWE